MAVFQAALINELEKIYKKKKVMVAIILSLAVIVLGQIAIVGVRSGFGLRGAGSSDFPILVLSIVGNTILPLFTALVTIDVFSGEFSNNIMRIALTRPVSRFKLFTAKITAVGIFILFNLIILFFLSSIVAVIFNSNSTDIGGYVKNILAYGVTLFPMLILALLVVVLSNIFKSGTSVFFMSILLFIGFKVIGILFSKYSGLLLTSYLDWYNLWLANTFPLGKIIRQAMIMLGYGIMFFISGFYLFERKEF